LLFKTRLRKDVTMQGSRLNKKGKTKKKKLKKWIRILIPTLLVLLIGAGAYAYSVYHNVTTAVKKMNVPLATKKHPKVNFNNGDPISILMVGVDERKGDSGRTDSMIVITVNPKTQTTKLLSIPRDTRTKLINKSNPSKDRFDKINAAYAYGGLEESIDTVENFINVPIDYYIKVNMQGFQDIVDAVGGIDVDNKYAFELDGVTLQTGPQHLTGIQALEYARMRHQDPKGDFGRQERQKEVISKIVQKGKSFSVVTKYNTILKALENNIQTNLTLDDIIGIQSSYKAAAKNMESLQVAGNGVTLDDIWYYQVDDQVRQSLSDEMRQSLGLQTEPVPKIIDTKATAQSSLASNSNSSNTSTATKSTTQQKTNTTTSTSKSTSTTTSTQHYTNTGTTTKSNSSTKSPATTTTTPTAPTNSGTSGGNSGTSGTTTGTASGTGGTGGSSGTGTTSGTGTSGSESTTGTGTGSTNEGTGTTGNIGSTTTNP
jgi:polyisoprenyl-teichoic acid--peptidoglycan teichoic acid transferase